MEDKNYTFGGKQYTENELFEFGKEHYPKFYWIPRGVGIGLMMIGVISATIYAAMAVTFQSKTGEHSTDSIFYTITIIFAVIAFIGAFLFAWSFKKQPRQVYINHAIEYLTRLNAKQVARKEKIQKAEERNSVKQILEYKQLLDAGIISQEEFDKKKQEFLNNKENF